MRSLKVQVCVCTQCVLHGAMDIIESVEDLAQLKYEMRHNVRVELETVAAKHQETSPVVYFNGETAEGCTCESVMESVLSFVHKSAASGGTEE